MTGTKNSGWHHWDIGGKKQISKAWGRAEDLYLWLSDNGFISKKANYIINNSSEANKVAKSMKGKQRCSALLFFDWDGNKYDKVRRFDHVAILGDILWWRPNNTYYIYYYAHTSDSYGECYLPGSKTYSSAYIQQIYKNNKYKNTKIYIYYL